MVRYVEHDDHGNTVIHGENCKNQLHDRQIDR